MKMQIDLKSVVFGLLLGAAAMFTMGDATVGQNGRYQISLASGAAGRAAIIIDTQTGKAWSARTEFNMDKDDGDAFWSAKNQ
jgi:hypothetical protein